MTGIFQAVSSLGKFEGSLGSVSACFGLFSDQKFGDLEQKYELIWINEWTWFDWSGLNLNWTQLVKRSQMLLKI